ncbi:UDP-N-acetylmuramoyl-tripeptide--D-alanyl-D-alanine ligase [soil metagenome]
MRRIIILLVLSYLRFFARLALALHQPIVIGIAGSVGKSSTRNALYAVLKDYFPTKMVYGNSETGIPLGILGIHHNGFSVLHWGMNILKAPFGILYLRKTKYLIVEMGIDEPFAPKNMSYLLTIVKPHIALSLNVSATHTLQFEKVIPKNHHFTSNAEKREFLINKIAQEDTKIISQSDCLLGIINKDDYHLQQALCPYLKENTKTTIQTFGKEKTNAVWYESVKISENGSVFSFGIADDEKTLTFTFPTLFLPREYQELFAAVILVGKYFSLSHSQIQLALEKNFALPKGRASLLQGINQSLIIDSSYNASKDAVLAFLSLLETLKTETERPVVLLFGDMRELGEESKIEHEEVALRIAEVVDYVYLVGSMTKQYVLPIMENKPQVKKVLWFSSALAAGKHLQESLPKNALILIKGSQNTLFLEEAIPYILQNKHDAEKLCRQEAYWKETKQKYFNR